MSTLSRGHMRFGSVFGVFLSGTAWRVAGSVLSLVVFAALARRMGSQAVALYAVAAATMYLLLPLPLLGLQLALVREAAVRDAAPGQLVRAALVISVPASFVIGLGVLSLASTVFAPGVQGAIRWVSAAVFVSGVICVGEVLLTAAHRSDLVGKLGVVETVVRGLASLALIGANASPLALVLLLVAGRVVLAAAYVPGAIAPAWRQDGAGWAGASRRLLATAPPYAAILVASALLARMDVLVLAHQADAAEVGRYAIAVKTFEIMALFSTFAMTAAYPLLARLQAGDRAAFLRVHAAVLSLAGIACLPLAFVGIAVATVAVEAVFGAAWQASGPLAGWFVVATFLTMFNQLFAAFFLIEQRPRDDLAALVVSCVATAALLYLLTARHGAAGAAWAVVAGSLVQLAARVALCTGHAALRQVGARLVATACIAALAAALAAWGGRPALAALAAAGVLLGLAIAMLGRGHCAGLVAQVKGAAP